MRPQAINITYINAYDKKIEIPCTLWGKSSNKLFIAVHGDLSHKEDTVIRILAENATSKGYQVLSFDLPEHGSRSDNNYKCNPQNSISDLTAIYNYAKKLSSDIYLFACSIGVYFSILAYSEYNIKKGFFLSPILNMEQIIQNMMIGFHISEQQLKSEKQILLPIGKTLDWDYYMYAKEHPITLNRMFPSKILVGSKDTVSEREDIKAFSKQYNAEFLVFQGGEHYFHTPEQLMFFERWLSNNL